LGFNLLNLCNDIFYWSTSMLPSFHHGKTKRAIIITTILNNDKMFGVYSLSYCVSSELCNFTASLFVKGGRFS
jgi:hypothetical protein